MKKAAKALIVTLILICNQALYSQISTGNVTGVVKEQGTGLTMPGVNVVVEGTLKGASTDANGKFTIEGLVPGKHNLILTFISYKTLIVEGVEVKPGTVTGITAEMTDSSRRVG